MQSHPVEAGSPAEMAGLQPGDVIEEANRQAVTSVEDLHKALARDEAKRTALLLVRRGGNILFFALTKAS
jgi:serine protease Do